MTGMSPGFQLWRQIWQDAVLVYQINLAHQLYHANACPAQKAEGGNTLLKMMRVGPKVIYYCSFKRGPV